MKFVTALLALALVSTARAQTTWKGLRFGESRDRAKAELAREQFAVETNQEGSLQSVADYDLLLPGSRSALPMRVDLHFSDDALTDVVLSLDLPAMRRNFPEIGDDGALFLFASQKFTRALTDKYGTPLSKQSDCDVDSAALARKQTATCEIDWHDPNQSVQLNWFARNDALFIRYQMLSPDL